MCACSVVCCSAVTVKSVAGLSVSILLLLSCEIEISGRSRDKSTMYREGKKEAGRREIWETHGKQYQRSKESYDICLFSVVVTV